MRDLNEIRMDIDRVDRDLLELYLMRMELVEEVAEYKTANGMKVLDAAREQEKLNALTGWINTEEERQEVTELFTEIMRLSRARQERFLAKKA